jgi:hypothetical protein
VNFDGFRFVPFYSNPLLLFFFIYVYVAFNGCANMSMPPIILLREGTEQSQGKRQIVANIQVGLMQLIDVWK